MRTLNAAAWAAFGLSALQAMLLTGCGSSADAPVDATVAAATLDAADGAVDPDAKAPKPPVSQTAPVVSKVTVAVAPGAPSALKPRLGANSVRLSFTPPASTGSSAIELYTATCRDDTRAAIGSATTSPVTVPGLKQLTNYSCTVSASNAQINGSESAPIVVNLPAPTAFTGRPTAPQSPVLRAGNGSATLSFAPPASDGGFPVVGYSATCTGGLGAEGLGSPLIITGARNGRSITCSVAAINAQGEGAASTDVTATPTATAGGPVPPGAPTGVVAAAGNAQVALNFAAPASTGGSPITGYQASCSNGGVPLFGTGLKSPIAVRGLANGTQYSCSVVAMSLYGASAASSSVAATPLASLVNAIDAPTHLTLGVTVPSLAADGTSTVIGTIRTASGAVYDGPDLTLTLNSGCAAAGKARMETSVIARQGTAITTYQPSGCTGVDTISAVVNGRPIAASARVVVSSAAGLSAKAALGKQMYFDKALSASGQQACASCHAPTQNFQAPNQRATQLGGVDGTAVGFRSAPAAAYAAMNKPFRFLSVTNQQGTVDNGANGKLGTPRGGQMWDGRDVDLAAQATGPFTAPHEMAMANNAAVRDRLLTRPYLATFSSLYGATNASSNADTVVANMAQAIAQFEIEDRAFMPFNSKYDAVQAGLASFTAQEANGQMLFSNARKAACIGCHTPFSQAREAQEPALFTDGAFRVIGVPRNWSLPYNNDAVAASAVASLGLSKLLLGASVGVPDHVYYDLGFCGPFRTDSWLDASLCGAFKTPSLRNVALKGAYFHNGVFGNLNQVLNFYLNRDTNPGAVYRKADGSADLPFNDLPTQYRTNVIVRPPFTPVAGGRMTPAEVQDLVSFLCTMSDGFDPANPTAYRQPLQCANAQRR